jgi:hypothetical protein
VSVEACFSLSSRCLLRAAIRRSATCAGPTRWREPQPPYLVLPNLLHVRPPPSTVTGAGMARGCGIPAADWKNTGRNFLLVCWRLGTDTLCQYIGVDKFAHELGLFR